MPMPFEDQKRDDGTIEKSENEDVVLRHCIPGINEY